MLLRARRHDRHPHSCHRVAVALFGPLLFPDLAVADGRWPFPAAVPGQLPLGNRSLGPDVMAGSKLIYGARVSAAGRPHLDLASLAVGIPSRRHRRIFRRQSRRCPDAVHASSSRPSQVFALAIVLVSINATLHRTIVWPALS